MRWAASWLGEAYCKLYSYFGNEIFNIDDCIGALGRDRETVRVVLSQLANMGYVQRMKRGFYQARDPTSIAFNIGFDLTKVDLRQKTYEPLLRGLLVKLFERYRQRLMSVVLYGSVARGTAQVYSDIDVLVVAEGLPQSFSDRIEEMVEVVDELQSLKLRLWRENKVYASVQIFPLTPEEAEHLRPLYLDLLFDAIILYDKNGFMREVLERLQTRLRELGSRRIMLPTGSWYWKLKPKLQYGEVIEL